MKEFEGKNLYLIKNGVVSQKLISPLQINNGIEALQINLKDIVEGILFLYNSGYSEVAFAIDDNVTGNYKLRVAAIEESEIGDSVNLEVETPLMH